MDPSPIDRPNKCQSSSLLQYKAGYLILYDRTEGLECRQQLWEAYEGKSCQQRPQRH